MLSSHARTVIQLLQGKRSRGELPPVLMVNTLAPPGGLARWSQEFEGELQQALGLSHDHADLLRLSPEGESYRLDDLAPLTSFLSHHPWQWRQKIVWVSEAQKLQSREVANTLLNVFESPPVAVAFILLNRGGAALLPTLKSRMQVFDVRPALDAAPHFPAATSFAQHLERLPLPESEELREWPGLLQDYAHKRCELQALCDFLRQSPDGEGHALQWLMGQAMSYVGSRGDYSEHQNLLKEMKWFQKSAAYHNSLPERLFGLLQVLNADVSSR